MQACELRMVSRQQKFLWTDSEVSPCFDGWSPLRLQLEGPDNRVD